MPVWRNARLRRLYGKPEDPIEPQPPVGGSGSRTRNVGKSETASVAKITPEASKSQSHAPSPGPPPQKRVKREKTRPESKYELVHGIPVTSTPPDYSLLSKSVNANVVGYAIHSSRQNWLNGSMFETFWTRKPRGKKLAEGQVNIREKMTKLHECLLTLGPHTFPVKLFAVRDDNVHLDEEADKRIEDKLAEEKKAKQAELDKLSAEKAEKTAGSDKIGPPGSVGVTHSEPANVEQANSKPVNVGTANSETASGEPATSEPATSEPATSELAISEPFNRESVNSELGNLEPGNLEAANSGTANSEPTMADSQEPIKVETQCEIAKPEESHTIQHGKPESNESEQKQPVSESNISFDIKGPSTPPQQASAPDNDIQAHSQEVPSKRKQSYKSEKKSKGKPPQKSQKTSNDSPVSPGFSSSFQNEKDLLDSEKRRNEELEHKLKPQNETDMGQEQTSGEQSKNTKTEVCDTNVTGDQKADTPLKSPDFGQQTPITYPNPQQPQIQPELPRTTPNQLVVYRLQQMAARDATLSELMKHVASGSAPPDSIAKFQEVINRVKASIFVPMPTMPVQPLQPSPATPKRTHSNKQKTTANTTAPVVQPKPIQRPNQTYNHRTNAKAIMLAIEFDESPTDRFLLPKRSILEYIPEREQMLWSFIHIEDRHSRNDKKKYTPITAIFHNIPYRISQTLERCVRKPEVVAVHMKEAMEGAERAKPWNIWFEIEKGDEVLLDLMKKVSPPVMIPPPPIRKPAKPRKPRGPTPAQLRVQQERERHMMLQKLKRGQPLDVWPHFQMVRGQPFIQRPNLLVVTPIYRSYPNLMLPTATMDNNSQATGNKIEVKHHATTSPSSNSIPQLGTENVRMKIEVDENQSLDSSGNIDGSSL